MIISFSVSKLNLSSEKWLRYSQFSLWFRVFFERQQAPYLRCGLVRGQPAVEVHFPLLTLWTQLDISGWCRAENCPEKILTRAVTHFYSDHDYKVSQPSSVGGVAVEDRESLGAWACGCNITRELEVEMPQTWVLEQVPFGCSWFNNDLCYKIPYSTPTCGAHVLEMSFRVLYGCWTVIPLKGQFTLLKGQFITAHPLSLGYTSNTFKKKKSQL